MGRGRTTFFDAIAALPWPVGLGVGVCGYLAIAHGIPLLFARADALGTAFRDTNPFMPLAWVFLGLCAFAALASFLAARRRRRLLESRMGLESIAALGGFTADAAKFAEGKPIGLIDGAALLGMIREVQARRVAPASVPPRIEPVLSSDVVSDSAVPSCPKCEAVMVRRNNSRTTETFWGCSMFPVCRGTR